MDFDYYNNKQSVDLNNLQYNSNLINLNNQLTIFFGILLVCNFFDRNFDNICTLYITYN